MRKINWRMAGAASLVVAGLALAGCQSSSHRMTGAKAGAEISAEASSSAAAAAKADLAKISVKCGTTSATGQLAAAHDMTTHSGRVTLMARCGVPKSQYKAVEAKLLAAAEKARLVSGGHAARVIFFEVTAPQIVLAAQS